MYDKELVIIDLKNIDWALQQIGKRVAGIALTNQFITRRVASRQTPYFLSRRQQKVSKKCLSPAVGISVASLYGVYGCLLN